MIDAARKYLPSVSKGAFEDKKLELCIEDGAALLQRCSARFDVVIVDGEGPHGQSRGLFTTDFYQSVMRSLKPGGLCCLQLGSFLDSEFDGLGACVDHDVEVGVVL